MRTWASALGVLSCAAWVSPSWFCAAKAVEEFSAHCIHLGTITALEFMNHNKSHCQVQGGLSMCDLITPGCLITCARF